ncbi:MAG TPA: L-rhamnose mutarotase, partial [Pilimelia sp.]|nr:L-rhamnose mutarotase [Pilimelia sp.]
MQRVALHTRLKPGREAEYDAVHAVIPAELDAALRAAGVRTWRIWRDGQDLFHVVEVDDYRRMRE